MRVDRLHASHKLTPACRSHIHAAVRTNFDTGYVPQLERWIDAMDASLPVLRNFILASGGLAACHLHVARSARAADCRHNSQSQVCRRAERRLAPLLRDDDIELHAYAFVNRWVKRRMCHGAHCHRLSDYLFVAARFAAAQDGRTETIYRRTPGDKTA